MAKKPTSGHIYRPCYTYKGQRVQSTIWWIAYYVKGKLTRESAETDCWEEANRKLKRRLGEVVTGKFAGLDAERVPLGQLLKAVEQDYVDSERSTLLDVQIRNRKHLQPFFGELRAADFSGAHLRRYIRQRKAERAANATINRELAILRRAFHLAAAEDPPLVTRVPVIEALPEDNVREGFLTREKYRALLEALPGRLRLLLVVGYHTGVRSGELRKIQWSQVDLKQGRIYVSRRTTKTKDAHTLPIYGDMAPWLEMAKAERDAKYPEGPWVFADENGQHIGTFRKAWTTACTAAGVPGLLFHDLRRSAAIEMDRAGVPRKVIMQITGHKTEAMFLRYRIVSSKDLSDAKERMERYIQEPEHKQVSRPQQVQ